MSAVLKFIKATLQNTNQAEVPLMQIFNGVNGKRHQTENELNRLVKQGKLTFRKTKYTTNFRIKEK